MFSYYPNSRYYRILFELSGVDFVDGFMFHHKIVQLFGCSSFSILETDDDDDEVLDSAKINEKKNIQYYKIYTLMIMINKTYMCM